MLTAKKLTSLKSTMTRSAANASTMETPPTNDSTSTDVALPNTNNTTSAVSGKAISSARVRSVRMVSYTARLVGM